MFETPILFIIFNRPIITQRTFDVIKQVKPKRLFIAADGPRLNQFTDIERCADTRSIIEQIDWPCNLTTLLRKENRGCGHGPAEAISWFFEHVEQGIILEDDCLADINFFTFCEKLLEEYKYDFKISSISGTNQAREWAFEENSYIYSIFGGNWGWATWRREWIKFDYSAKQWHTDQGKNKIRLMLKNETMYSHFFDEFDKSFNIVREDIWDLQWFFCRLLHGTCSIVPTKNLVSNIGFNSNATHTFYTNDSLANIPIYTLDYPIKKNAFKINKFYDWYIFNKYMYTKKKTILTKICLKTISLINNMKLKISFLL